MGWLRANGPKILVTGSMAGRWCSGATVDHLKSGNAEESRWPGHLAANVGNKERERQKTIQWAPFWTIFPAFRAVVVGRGGGRNGVVVILNILHLWGVVGRAHVQFAMSAGR